MLQPQDLYPHLPRRIQTWTPQDVKLWFSLHSISTNPSFDFEEHRFDGESFLKVTPEYLFDQCGVGSVIVIKKIIEWLEQDLEEFQEYVGSQNSKMSIDQRESKDNQKSIKTQTPRVGPNKENTPSNNQLEQPTEKPKHIDSIQSLQNVKKWNKSKRKSLSCEEKPIETQQGGIGDVQDSVVRSNKCISSNVKFAESNYQICETLVRVQYKMEVHYLRNSGKIGRSKQNDVLIPEDSVSRQHAQLLRINNQYYLQDLGSKYGTFREIGINRDHPLEEGDKLAFDDFEVQVISLKVNAMKSPTFDLKIKVRNGKESIMNFFSKKSISIGFQNKDISLNHTSIAMNHAKIAISPDKKIYLLKQEGDSFLKLKKDELYQLQGDSVIRLGLQAIKVSVIRKSKPICNISEFAYK